MSGVILCLVEACLDLPKPLYISQLVPAFFSWNVGKRVSILCVKILVTFHIHLVLLVGVYIFQYDVKNILPRISNCYTSWSLCAELRELIWSCWVEFGFIGLNITRVSWCGIFPFTNEFGFRRIPFVSQSGLVNSREKKKSKYVEIIGKSIN